MASLNQEIFCGGMFDFDVGESRKRFTLHKTVVGRVSEPLSASMSNGMKESNEGVAWLEDVDIDTFQRFAEWAYTGDYTPVAPRPIITIDDKKSNDNVPNLEPVEGLPAPLPSENTIEPPVTDDPWGNFSTAKKRSKKKKGQAGSHHYIGPFRFKPELSWHSEEWDFSDCFLSHACLYVFADQKQIVSLAKLATTRLDQALATAGRNKQRGHDIACLVEYVYNNTANLEWEKDPLRRVIVDHAARMFEVLAPTADFRDLLFNGGDFVTDVSVAVASRLESPPPLESPPLPVLEEPVAVW